MIIITETLRTEQIQVRKSKELSELCYTSKCSFLDNESIEYHDVYLDKRVKRGLFRTAKGILINADVNAALNILKKAFPNAFVEGIAGLVLIPFSKKV